MEHPTYSIVVPICDEEDTLPEPERRLVAVFDRLDGEAEAILVDDGSSDRSYELMTAISERDARFKIVRLSRNFGHQLAITAGLDLAAGDPVVVMDGDLQDPPEVIPELAARWREGFQVVYGVRATRAGEPRLRLWRARLFYRTLRRLTDVDIPVDAGDFRLIDRQALDAFKSMRENNRYIRGMTSWIGFRQIGVPYSREERFAGVTKYPLGKLMKLGADGVLSFSIAPLRMALKLGIGVSLIAFMLAFGAVVAKLAGLYDVPGIASLVFITLFLGGVQLMILGILGEYVARVYEEVKDRPLYVISEHRGFPSDAELDADRVLTRGRQHV
jgi:polyisoprenyl-phosphate glycosyltransferase